MQIELTPAQRDAFYDQILDRLSGIDDLRLAAYSGNFATAEQLARTFSDDLRFLCDDLGWGAASGERVELQTPSDVLRRVFRRIGDAAAGMAAFEKQQAAEARELARRNSILIDACRLGLAALGEDGS